MRPLTHEELLKSDQIIDILPEDQDEALLVLSSIVEAVCIAVDESHHAFMDRVKWWEKRRS